VGFFVERRLPNGAQIWQISAHKFGLNFVGEIEHQMFCRMLCAGVFLLGKQSLVKLTQLSKDSSTGLGNVRPAGHMRPAKHLNVAREHFLKLI